MNQLIHLASFMVMVCGLSVRSASANPYDECVLQYMSGAQNKDAVYAIERSCINKSSVIIPSSVLENMNKTGFKSYAGDYNVGSGKLERGLLVNFINTTSYDVTELNVTVVEKLTGYIKYYNVRDFVSILSPGVFLSGLPEPYFENIIKSGEERRFFVEVSEVSAISSDFGKKYVWDVKPVRGIPLN